MKYLQENNFDCLVLDLLNQLNTYLSIRVFMFKVEKSLL